MGVWNSNPSNVNQHCHYPLTLSISNIQKVIYMSNLQAITDDSFENEVISSTIPVLVDFWAQWCGPCKALAPILEETANHYVGKVKFAKMDVDGNPATPPKFGIRGIPTIILFKNGQVKGTHVGLLTKGELQQFIDQHT